MARVLLPSGIGKLVVPGWDIAPHIVAMESELLKLAKGVYRRLMLSIPIRHGKSQMVSLFIAWLLIFKPTMRILRVMENSTTSEKMALETLSIVEQWGPKLTGVRLDRRKCSADHFRTTAGGELRSLGFSGSAESWTFDLIVGDDIATDPYIMRSPNRREQIFHDWNTKFMSRVSPVGNTKFLFISSRRHPYDVAGRLLESDTGKNDAEKWHYHHSPAILHEGTDHEEALWPTAKEFDLEGLRKIRNQKIADGVQWEWSCLFQNDPIASPDMMAFDPSWFQPPEKLFYTCPVDALPPITHQVISIDPSMGPGSELNDYFACLYLLFTGDGRIYVDDCFLQVCAPDAAIAACVAMAERHPEHEIAVVEANAGGRYIEKLLRDECARREIPWRSVFKTWSAGAHDLDMGNKLGRITLALWEKLSKGKIMLRDTPHNRVLFRQLRGLGTEKDDGPDALAMGDIVLRELLTQKRR